jgi:hypothetical protein
VILQLGRRKLVSGAGACSLLTQWTVYPTGQVFRWDSLWSMTAAFDTVQMNVFQKYEGSAGITSNDARMYGGKMTVDTVHNYVTALLAAKNAGSAFNYPFSGFADTAKDTSNSASGNSGTQFRGFTDWAAGSYQTVFYMDMERSNTRATNAFADSVGKSWRYPNGPKVDTIKTGSAESANAGDLNGDGFWEKEGAYVLKADGSNCAMVRFGARADTCLFNPAFRITNYYAAQVPQYVFVNSHLLTRDYEYNVYLKRSTKELVLQIDTVLCGADSVYISYDRTLAVTMDEFRATPGDKNDTLFWRTESEQDNLGFYLLRRVKPAFLDTLAAMAGSGGEDTLGENGAVSLYKKRQVDYRDTNWVSVNQQIIPGASEGVSFGPRSYRYVDYAVHNDILYEYKIEAVDYRGEQTHYGPVQVKPGSIPPLQFALWANFPNPFRHATTIRYDLPVQSRVELAVYDLSGRRIVKLIKPERKLRPGYYRTVWDGRDEYNREVASGPYVYRLTAEGFAKARVMLMVR